MKKTIWQTAVVVSGFWAVAHVSASDVFVGAYDLTTNFVAQGASAVQTDRIAVSFMGDLRKTGGGEWTVASSSIFQHWPFTLAVEEGTFSFGAGSGTPPANTSPSILDSAALWVAADDPDATHLDKSGNELSTWYDVRETDVSNPRYLRAKSEFDHTTDRPTVTTKDGMPSVYFGGMGSGIAMRYYAPGATEYSQVMAYHLFAVVGFYSTQGAVFGSGGSAGNSFMAQTIAGTSRIYADPSRLWNSTSRAIVNVDGERCDPYADKAPAGRFHLFDMATPYADGTSTGSFFAQWGSKIYWGGDYLAEAIVFTNRISAADHAAIQSYLSHKWFGTTGPVRKVALAKDATYKVDAAGDTEMRDTVFTGDGTVEKTGSGTLFYRTADPWNAEGIRFAGFLDLAAGAADLSTSLPLAATGGQTVETSVTGTGNVRTTVASGLAETFAKTGKGTLAVAGAPAGARKIMVQDGTLDVRPSWSNTVSSSGSYEIPITNPSFETYATEEEFDAAHGVISMSDGDFVNGWRRRTNAARIFYWDKWTDKQSFVNYSRADYNQTCPPIDGHVAVMVHQNGCIETEVTIPETGLYELSLDIYNRQTTTYLGCYAICTLVDEASGTTVANFGRAYYYEPNYRRVALRAQVNSTGKFLLRTRACNQPTGYQIVVDNFALRRVGEAEQEYGAWKVPNGDFEYNAEIFGSNTRDRVKVSPFANWTFDQGSGNVGVTVMAVTNSEGYANVECNGTRGPYGGSRQLLMKENACSATVTFTPPAGEWFVRADVARYFRHNGTLSVSAAFGGDSHDLGSVPVDGSLMKPKTWPVSFVADGNTSVALTFSFARSEGVTSPHQTGAFLDDVRLVPCGPDTEYLVNPGFETRVSGNWAKDWTKITDAAAGTASVQPYSYLPNVFSADQIQGGYFIYLERDGGAAQDVTFNQAGWYRLSFYASLSRRAFAPDGGWYSRPSPVRAWLAQGAVTNVIGNTGYFSNTNYCQYVWDFKVPAAGTYTFAVQGTETNKGYNACLDALSIRRMDGEGLVLPEERTFAEDTIVQVDEGARLRVAFEGTNTVRRIVLGGKSLGSGVFNVADYPGYLDGYGTFLVKQRGVVINIR